jgi:hypothetical protein
MPSKDIPNLNSLISQQQSMMNFGMNQPQSNFMG